MIKLTRIDDRLLHGQVSFTWVPALSVDTVIVANDKTAKDEFLKMTMNLAKPSGIKILIKSIADTIAFLLEEKNTKLKVLILISSIKDAAILSAGLSEIKSVNFGGIRGKEGSRLISKAIAITDDDIPMLRQMIRQGIELEIRQVPTEGKQLVEPLIEN
jgi:fructoselysine and glucoselysine-specific PTS system IIB component